MAFLGPSLGSKGPHCAVCNYSFRNLIGCHDSSHSGPFLNGMILGIVQLDHCLLAATVIRAITQMYMKSSREGFIISMKGLHHHIHACSHYNQWGASLDSFIQLRWDDFCPCCADYFIQLEKIFHSPVWVRHMVFKFERLLASSLGHLDHSLPNSDFFLDLGQ